jgi:hypothetical protein
MVAIVGKNNQIFTRTGISNELPQGLGWTAVNGLDQVGKWEQVTLGENGHMWMLSDKQIFRYTNEVATPGFKAVSGHNFKQINCGNWELVAVTVFNEVYHRTKYNADSA